MKSSAPTPPIGPSTLMGITTLLVGLVGAALSLCGVVVDDETTRQIGTVVGGIVALAALGYTTWSRTRQAQTLARAERSSWGENPPTTGTVLGQPQNLSLEVPGGGVVPDGERP